jgi:hypothetical protein
MFKIIALASLTLLACSSAPADDVQGGTDDLTGAAKATRVALTCESYGAKVVIREAGAGTFEAVVTGKAAELIRDEQGKDVTAVGGGYDSGKTWTTKKRLPNAVANNFAKAGEAPVVTLGHLSRSESGGKLYGYFSGQYDPAVAKEATGYKVVIPYFEMTGSHTTMTYEYANWFFADQDCK